MSVPTKMTPQTAWKPIAESQWTEDNIRHLLRRASWTARPAEVKRLAAMTPGDAIDHLFKRAQYPTSHPILNEYADKVDEGLGDEINEAIAWAKAQPRYKDRVGKIKAKTYRDPHVMAITIAHYNKLRSEARNSGQPDKFRAQFRSRFGQEDSWRKYAHEWLKIANRPQNSAFEKANNFLQNIWVVNYRSLRGPSNNALADIHNHHNVLRKNFYESYPALCKQAYKTRGMGYMLDLPVSTKNRPNENFARELMELFTLGVDNGYTEDDIKEISKAFTGYSPDPDRSPYTLEPGQTDMILNPAQHDDSRKKVFGRSRDYDGDAIVDLIFERPEVEVFLPHELCRFYLIDEALPEGYIEALGKGWRENDFNVYWLIKTLFTSQLFYADSVRGRIFKSPNQFYLGLLQDLGLQVEPSVEVVRELDYLGQPFADPPDVNGWNGGAFWMNNGSINARRLIAQRLFSGDYRRGMKATDRGGVNYVVTDEMLGEFFESSGKKGREAVDHFITYLLPVRPKGAYNEALQSHFAKAGNREDQIRALKQVILAILQSQYYQVC